MANLFMPRSNEAGFRGIYSHRTQSLATSLGKNVRKCPECIIKRILYNLMYRKPSGGYVKVQIETEKVCLGE